VHVAVSGSGGLIGRAAVAALRAGGDDVTLLQRRSSPSPSGLRTVVWPDAAHDPDAARRLAGVDAVLHLAGSPIAAGRWTAAVKREIRLSRVDATKALIEVLGAAGARPRAFVCASAVGYYGDRGDEELDERSAPGDDFLAQVCRAWEEAAQGAEGLGARVVRLRTGVVLAREGGMLARLLPFFRAGLGGPVGSGRQWLPWIDLEDEVGAILALLRDPDAQGPFNLAAPEPVRSRSFAQALGRTLGRPAFLTLPGAAVRAVFGEMGAAVLLGGQRALPQRLLATGYRFRRSAIEDALRHALGQG